MGQEIAVKKDFKFTNRVIGNTVFMLLNQAIGPDHDEPNEPYIDGSRFADEMYYWKSQGKHITVKINTPGGRVDHGWSMIDAIQECAADTFDAGIAYSMGGICLLFGKNRKAYDYAVGMIHAPQGGNKEVLEVVRNQFRTLLETRTKFTKAEIDDMMTSGKNYFFTASEMLEKGIIDEVVPSGLTINPPANASAKALCTFYNNYIDEHKTINLNMKNIFAGLFKKETEEEAVVAAIDMRSENESLKTSNTQLETENKELKAKLEKIETDVKSADSKVKSKELIENAIKAGKLSFKDSAEKDKAIENATANFEFTKSLIDNMPAKKEVSAASFVSEENKGKQLTYAYLSDKDPKKLEEIAETDPELYAKLESEFIESKRTK
jgi:ATP-dependent protease ClpP protease subunit